MRLDGYQITTPVSQEPITLTDIKQYTRIDFADDDATLSALITRCRSYAESVTRRSLAPKTIQCILRPDPVPAGRLYGPVDAISDPLLYAERLSTSPFGTVPFVLQLPFPPVQSVTSIDYQIWPFQQPTWTNLPATDANNNAQWILNNQADPGEMFFSYPIVANRFRVTMVCGYDPTGVNKVMEDDLKMLLSQMVAWRYDNRVEDWPAGIQNDLMHYRVEYF